MQKEFIIGIDLGTTQSAVGIFQNGESIIIPNSLNETMTPSVVSVDDNANIIIGAPAKERLITAPEATIASFKRFMGSSKKIYLGNETFSPEELSAFILKRLKEDAEHYLKMEVSEAIISVPAYFNHAQRKATLAAADIAGLNVKRLINEPTAAALTYGVQNPQDENKYLVVDLGGGTFDVSVLEAFNGILEIRASAGDNYLGGNDFTEKLLELFYRDTYEKYGDLKEQLTLTNQARLYRQIESAKHSLSFQSELEVKFETDEVSIDWQITRERFQTFSKPLLDRIKNPLERAIRDARLNINDINEIFLVGGATRMPMIRAEVGKLFRKLPQINAKPDEVVVSGAAIQAALTQSDEILNDIVVTDVCPFTLGTAVMDYDSFGGLVGEVFQPLIERNTILPTSQAREFTNCYDNQKKILVKVYQGESYHLADNILLGQLELEIAPKPRDQEHIEIRFSYDINGILEVEAKSLTTKQQNKVVIKNHEKVMDEDEIEASLKRLQNYKIHPREETENQLLLAKLASLYEEMLGQSRDYIKTLINEFSAVLNQQDQVKIDHIKFKIKEVLNEFA